MSQSNKIIVGSIAFLAAALILVLALTMTGTKNKADKLQTVKPVKELEQDVAPLVSQEQINQAIKKPLEVIEQETGQSNKPLKETEVEDVMQLPAESAENEAQKEMAAPESGETVKPLTGENLQSLIRK